MNSIFEEFTFPNGSTIRNRLCLAPMTTYSSNDDLTLSDEEEVYYNSRAKSFGMIITSACAINKHAQSWPNQISARDVRYLDSLTRLANSIKKEGAKAILQLHHGGRMNRPNLYKGQEIVGPSAIKGERDFCVVPRELRTSEVYDIKEDFVEATVLAMRAGFDGVEIHGANGYLIQQFMSKASNARDDEFGGDSNKNLTFAMRVVKRILRARQYYGKPDFIIGYRFSPEEINPLGLRIDKTQNLLNNLCKLPIDYLHVSLGKYDQTSIRNLEDQKPIYEYLLEVINNRIPLIGVGGIDTLEKAEDAMSKGYDLLSLGTSALADKDIVTKFQNKEVPKRVIDQDSLLPAKMVERLKKYKLNGYQIK